jgi:hypothetical protein
MRRKRGTSTGFVKRCEMKDHNLAPKEKKEKKNSLPKTLLPE